MEQVLSKDKAQTLQQSAYLANRRERTSILSRFINWCDAQEDNRFMWLGVSLFGSIGAVLPITLMMVTFAFSNNFTLWMLAAVVNVPVLAINLAAQPTKITLPFLFFAWLTNLGIILYSAAVLIL